MGGGWRAAAAAVERLQGAQALVKGNDAGAVPLRRCDTRQARRSSGDVQFSPTPSSPPGLNLTYTLTWRGGGAVCVCVCTSGRGRSSRSVRRNASRGVSFGEAARRGRAKPKSVSRERDLRRDDVACQHAGEECWVRGGGLITLWPTSRLTRRAMTMPGGEVNCDS